MSELHTRIEAIIRKTLGQELVDALADSDVEEVQVNPDMSIHITRSSCGTIQSKTQAQPASVETFLRAVATQNKLSIAPSNPVLATTLPSALGKCRVQGFLPPITEAPSFILRKPPSRVIELDEYIAYGSLSSQGAETIRTLVSRRANIMVAGPTSSGKTTLCNAILNEVVHQFPSDRLVILEDTRELYIVHQNQLRMQTTPEHTMRHLVAYALRSTPDRIIVGEVRDHAARDLLDAWITGHPGGCGTVHGEDAQRALGRLASLAQEATPGIDQRPMVSDAVQAIVFIKREGQKRVVTTIATVDGLDDRHFILNDLPT